jgi:hypothetical protein
MVAQAIKKKPETAMSIKRFNMAKPPHISIHFRALIIEARFIPKQNPGKDKNIVININWLEKEEILGCQTAAEKFFPESRI